MYVDTCTCTCIHMVYTEVGASAWLPRCSVLTRVSLLSPDVCAVSSCLDESLSSGSSLIHLFLFPGSIVVVASFVFLLSYDGFVL